ncbi:LppU/SCO3897 family protein [Lentzea sp. CA-135723]|uniref:LppU/SCO3897 family protein n=1 Tax=Lentzea sp. CA-135723 TaxID=3239950 RepID=UPI003D915117
MKLLGTAALVAVLVLSGCAGCSVQAGVGECATQTDMNSAEVAMTEVDCSSSEAVYRVSSRERRTMCPEGDYLTESSGRSRTNGKTRLCYVLNVSEGDCLKPVNQYFERVPCGSGVRKVSKVVDGQADRALCGGADSRTYSQPVKTICITG